MKHTSAQAKNRTDWEPQPAIGKDIPEKRRPLPALTGIRIFAAYYVVTYHTGAGYVRRHHGPQLFLHFLDKGYLAVSLFFVLSGFILAYTYEGKISGRQNTVRFWEARFARIYPVYILSLILMIPLFGRVTAAQKSSVLFMVQTWLPGPWQPNLSGAWNFPAWSLSVEAFFYLVFPLLLPFLGRMKSGRLRWLTCLLLALIAFGNLTRPLEGWSQSSILLLRWIPLPVLRLPEFVVGTAAALIFLRAPKWRWSGPISIVATLSAVIILCLVSDRWASIAIVPFAILIGSLAGQAGPVARVLSNRVLVLLGGASYTVYLLQLPIRGYTRLLISKLPQAPRNLDEFLSPCLLLLVSLLVFLYWEEPSRKFLRQSLRLRPRWKWPYFPTGKRVPDAGDIKSQNDHLL